MIFVSIASYRDPKLHNTLDNLIKKCSNWKILRVVVFEQNGYGDKSVDGMYECVEVIKTHYSNARGPYWARAIIQKFYKNEEYYLQIDSHTEFVDNWDIKLISMGRLLPNPYVITQYPSFKVRSGLYIQGFSRVDKMPRIQSNYSVEQRYYPYTCKAWSACFSFSKGSIVRDAPYDEKLVDLFFGEEFDITLRLFTRGYFFYAPHIPIASSLFDRSYRRTFWQDNKIDSRNSVNELIRRIKCGHNFGNTRSLSDYMEFADIEILFERMKKHSKAHRKNNYKNLLI